MLLATGLPAQADPRPAAGARPVGEALGMAWLVRIQNAAQKLNYSGTFVYQQGNHMQSSRVTHAHDLTGEHEKLEILDGQAVEYIRHNDELKCYSPEAKVVVTEKRPATDRFPGLLVPVTGDLEQFYKITRVGSDRVAGRPCQVTLVEPRDGLRYGYRLWTDQASGLLLKAQTLNERGEVIEQVGFSEVSIGEPIERNRFRPSARSLAGWRWERVESQVADFSLAGWTLRTPVPGFQKVREVKRSFAGRREVGQMVFSDGLANISVFIEAGAAPGATEGEQNRGPTNVVSRRHGEFWLTVVGEAPAASIRQLANSLEFAKSTAK